MVSPRNISALLSLAVLIALFSSASKIFSMVLSNSLIRLLLLMSFGPVLTTNDRLLHHLSLAASVVGPFLALLYKILTLVSPAVVPTLLSNFTFGGVVIAFVSFLLHFIAICIACCFQGTLSILAGIILGLYFGAQEKQKVQPGETMITDDELQEKVKTRLERLCSDYEFAINIYTALTTVYVPNALTSASVRYAMFSYYSVLLPPLLNANASARLVPMDIVVYAVVVALGVHVTHNMLLAIRALHKVAYNRRLSRMSALKILAELYWVVVMTGLIAVRYAEKQLVGGSVGVFGEFLRMVMVDVVYRLCMGLVMEKHNVPKWVKTWCAVGMGLMKVMYGRRLWQGIDQVGVKFAARYAMT